MENEIWKDVVDFEGCYQISNIGRLRSMDRIVGKKSPRFQKGVIIKLCTAKSGYQYLDLHRDNLDFGTNIHRLVAMAFIPNPKNKPQVNHKNGIRDDNRVENLEWATLSENHLHAYKKLNRINPAAVPVVMVDRYGKELARFSNCTEAGKAVNKHYSTVSDYITGKIPLSREGYTFIRESLFKG